MVNSEYARQACESNYEYEQIVAEVVEKEPDEPGYGFTVWTLGRVYESVGRTSLIP